MSTKEQTDKKESTQAKLIALVEEWDEQPSGEPLLCGKTAVVDFLHMPEVEALLRESTPSATREPERETLVQLRERFEQWFKMTRPLFGNRQDTTLKHQLWTAWQVAHVPQPYVHESPK